MESWVVLGLGVGYLWNRTRKFNTYLETVPDNQELKEAQRPIGENNESLCSTNTPKSEKARLEAMRVEKQCDVQEFNGGTAEITGEYLPVKPYQ